MMYIIRLDTYEDGSRPALQEWNKSYVPTGYALCSEEFYDIFYSTEVACGFVNITVENDTVIFMEINQEALDAYIASLPEPEEPVAELDMYDELAAAIREGVNEI